MFAYIKGQIDTIAPSQVFIDVNGVGYDIQTTLNTYEAIQNKKECRLYTHLQIRDDAWILYGFATISERDSFRRLISISGVGAATARIMLSSLTPNQLHQIIEASDEQALKKIKGIGAKTAQRIILELRGKLPAPENEEKTSQKHNTKADDTLNALVGLGIAKTAAQAALKKSKPNLPDNEDFTVEDWIKEALKSL